MSLRERALDFVEEDTASEADDDLDMIPQDKERQLMSFDKYFKSTKARGASESSQSGTESSSSRKGKRRNEVNDKGERIAFDADEDSDAVYTAFKKRKTIQRSKALASTKRARAQTAKNSLVGRRPKTLVPLRSEKRVASYGDAIDDEEFPETKLPEYLKTRKTEWEERREKMGTAGLRVPPGYDDVYFSDDDRLESLKERPSLPTGTRQGSYKDIELPYSAGIIPASIAQWLRKYQVDGAAFLHELFVYQRGGILGDDMGLGKTIQVIAFLTAAFGKTGDERDWKRMRKIRRSNDERWYPRVLVIAPGSLMSNWKSELDNWGWWQIYTYHGSAEAKQAALAAAERGRLEIMITTYTTYRLNKSAINGIRWDCVIADECHMIKEPKSEVTKALNEVNALCRIGLTGTAIQNKYEELWTLLNWTNPGHFGPLVTWKQAICLPLKLGQSHDATVSQLSRGRRTAEKLVRNLLPPFFLRRMKSLIADQLPKKSDRVVFCPLTDNQQLAYNNLCDSELLQIIRNAAEPCACGSGKKQGWCCYSRYEGKPWHAYVFPCLVALRNLANHVALLLPANETDKEKHERELERLAMALPDTWRELYAQRDSIMNYANTEFCGKWKVLKKLLKYWYENADKVLVFSHSVRLLKMLNMLFKATTSYNVAYLDGSMTYEERTRAVEEFNSDPTQFVFLISTKAGGVGLNIVSANKVVVVDPNWNPSYDLQAQDRAYRIGQTRDVQVFRLVSVGTVEELVYARQIYKQQQANIGYNASAERRYFSGVQDQKDMKGEIFGLRNLFAPLDENVRLRDIVNKTNIAETRSGVEIAGLDLEPDGEDEDNMPSPAPDDANEDAALSQLAADIVGLSSGKKTSASASSTRRKDAVQGILASAGVSYTHENAEVIGTSKIETRISNRAQKAGNDVDTSRDLAFVREVGSTSLDELTRTNDAVDGFEEDRIKYRYRPTEDVRRRQFCTMARHFGYEDVTEFALVVEGWTQSQRRACLEKFYSDRKIVVGGGQQL